MGILYIIQTLDPTIFSSLMSDHYIPNRFKMYKKHEDWGQPDGL